MISIKRIGIALTIVAVISCEENQLTKEEEIPQPSPSLESGPVLDYLLAIGHKIENVVDCGSHYQVEGDLFYDKEWDLNSAFMNNGRLQYYEVLPLITKDKQQELTVRIDPSVAQPGPDDWTSAIQHAIADWNALTTCMIKLTQVTSNADITFITDEVRGTPFSSGTSAGIDVTLRNAGEANPFIFINLDFNDTPLSDFQLTFAQRRNTMVHELGHAIGYGHTDFEGPNYALVPGTNNNDVNSVMWSGTALRAWQGFSNKDITMTEYTYPAIEDEYFYGDWDGDGTENIAIRRANQILMDTDTDSGFEIVFYFGDGNSEDEYLVGDFNGDGDDDIAVRDGNTISADLDRDGVAEYTKSVGNGNSEDEYLIGDFGGDSRDDIAVRRNSTIWVDTDHNGSLDYSFTFGNGNSEDYYLVGDWHDEGKDQVATVKDDLITYKSKTVFGLFSILTLNLGRGEPDDEYLAGDWNGGGDDDFGVRRDNKVLADTNRNGSFSGDYRETIGFGTTYK